jgi:hypothetical protein
MKAARAIAITLGLLSGAAHAGAGPVPEREVYFDVPQQALGKALTAFAAQSDLRIVYFSEATDGITALDVRSQL